jgi:hypothetical protein
MAVVALALLGGAAPVPQGEKVQTYRLDRWGFAGRGPTDSDVAYRYCTGDRLLTVNSRRTAGDWATIVLSAGWYTPEHVTLKCAPR